MKRKLSVTLDAALVSFLDDERGTNRSEKLEEIVRTYRKVKEDFDLREKLASAITDDDPDLAAWRSAMEEAQWKESNAATSGRSRSRRSPSRGRR